MVNCDYIVVVHELKEEDGGGFLAIAPDLPGCVGDGDDRAAAVADLEKAMAEWIDEAVRLNREVPKPGACFAEVNAQQEKVKNLLKAQEDLIRQQDQRLKEQDQHLKEARQEIERIKASIVANRPHHLHGEVYPWNVLEAVPVHMAAAASIRKHHGRRLN
jgi:antitoxin HicB